MTKSRNSKKPNVLLIDDDAADQEIFERLVQKGVLDAQLQIANSGEEALEQLALKDNAQRPDLIFLDLNMPGLGGHATLAKLREAPGISTTPIIVLSTSDADADVIKSYELGANSFITKPISFDEFVRIVREIDEYWFEIVTLPST